MPECARGRPGRVHAVSAKRPASPLSAEQGESVSGRGGGSRHSRNQKALGCKPQAHSFLALCPWAGLSSLSVPSGVAVAESCREAHTS